MNKLTLFWDSIRSNKYWVAFEGAASGSLLDYFYESAVSGSLNLSAPTLKHAAGAAIISGISAVRLLYRPQPVPTVVAITPPDGAVEDVAARLTPVDPKDVPVNPTTPVTPAKTK
jgi:hypothetical protein